MVKVVTCPKCTGSGCSFCKWVGTVLKDENGSFYLNERQAAADNKNFGFKQVSIFLLTPFKEPHDFLWMVKSVKG